MIHDTVTCSLESTTGKNIVNIRETSMTNRKYDAASFNPLTVAEDLPAVRIALLIWDKLDA